MEEREFIRRFEDLSLTADEFNHRGHLWLGWLYIRDCSLRKASQRLNAGIKAFARSLGAEHKYNYTLTTTFTCAIKSRFKKDQTFEQFLNANEDLVTNAMQIIQTHYSPELLKSVEARSSLVAPDRKPFPKEYVEQIGLIVSAISEPS